MAAKTATAEKLAPTPEAAAVWVDVESLVPWVENPRKNDEAVDAVARSIQNFGWGSPLLARKANGELIAGHTRLKAALKLGIAQVPVRYLDLDPAQAHLLALADNKLNELAEWDYDVLPGLLRDVAREDALLAGFTSDELAVLLKVGFEPPPIDDNFDGNSDDAGTQSGSGIKLTREERERFNEAVAEVRRREKKPKMPDGEVLMVLVASYMMRDA